MYIVDIRRICVYIYGVSRCVRTVKISLEVSLLKKTCKKILSIILSVAMLLGAIGVTTIAGAIDVRYDSTDRPQLTSDQSSTMVMDVIDDMLKDMAEKDTENHSKIEMKILTFTLKVDYSSVDAILKTVYDLSGGINLIKGAVGDLKDLKLDALIKKVNLLKSRAYSRGEDGDLTILNQLVQFLNDNRGIVAKFVNGNLSLGTIVEGFLPDNIKDMIHGGFSLHDMAVAGIYDNLVNMKSVFSNQPYNDSVYAKSLTLDEHLNNFVQKLVTTNDYDLLGKAILTHVDATVASSFNDILRNNVQTIIDELGVQPANADVKKMLAQLCGVKFGDEITDETLLAKLKALPRHSQPFNSTDYYVVEGEHFFRRDGDYYQADLSGKSPLFDLVNWDYDVTGITVDASSGFVAALPALLSSLAGRLFTADAQAKLASYGFSADASFNTNITALAKLILPNCPSTFFYSGFDMSLVAEENIKDMSLDDILVLILTAIFNGSFDNIVIPGNAQYPAQVGVMALREVLIRTAAYNNYDAKIFAADPDGRLASDKFVEGKDKAYWTELAAEMGTDLAVFYINNMTNFNVGPEKVAQYKAAGWGYEAFLDEIMDWGFAYAGDLFAGRTDGLNFTRGDGASDPYAKADVLFNAILDWSFVNDGSADANLSTKKLLDVSDPESLVNKVFNFDFEGVFAFFSGSAVRNAAGNIFEMPLNKALVSIVAHLLNGIIPGAINASSVNVEATRNGKPAYVDNFLANSNLSAMVSSLLGALNTNKEHFLGKSGSTGGVLNVIVENLPDFGAAQTFRSPSFGEGTEGSGDVSLEIVNRARGVASAYNGVADRLYTLNVSSIVADGKTVSPTSATGITNGQSKKITVKGVGDGQVVKVTFTYNITGPDGNNISDNDLVRIVYLNSNNAEDQGDTSALRAKVAAALDEVKKTGDLEYDDFDFRLYEGDLFKAQRSDAEDIVDGDNYSACEMAYCAYMLKLTYGRMAANGRFGGNNNQHLKSAIDVAETAEYAADADKSKLNAALEEAKRVLALGTDKSVVSQHTIYYAMRNLKKAYASLASDGKISVGGKIGSVVPVVHTHTEETIPGKAATCTETGLTDGIKCSVCGEIIKAQEVIPAKGHTEQTVAGKAATCAEAGLTDGTKCSVCGVTLKAQETIPASGHTEQTVAGKAATCTETGLTDGTKCSVCGTTLKAQETIPAKGHVWDGGTVTKAPTTTQTGIKTFKCTVCGATRNEKLDKLPKTDPEEPKTDPTTEPSAPIVYGDIDGDGERTAADARSALRIAVKLDAATDAQAKAADVDGKDGVTAADARLILRFAVKLEKKFPVEG